MHTQQKIKTEQQANKMINSAHTKDKIMKEQEQTKNKQDTHTHACTHATKYRKGARANKKYNKNKREETRANKK